VFVSENVVVNVPTRAVTVNGPPMELASTGMLARPVSFVVARGLTKMPLAPEGGAVKVTTAPTSGLLLPSRTETTRGAGYGVLTGVLCGVPDCALTVAGHPALARCTKDESVPSPAPTTRWLSPGAYREGILECAVAIAKTDIEGIVGNSAPQLARDDHIDLPIAVEIPNSHPARAGPAGGRNCGPKGAVPVAKERRNAIRITIVRDDDVELAIVVDVRDSEAEGVEDGIDDLRRECSIAPAEQNAYSAVTLIANHQVCLAIAIDVADGYVHRGCARGVVDRRLKCPIAIAK
jgi:hypothetical protein